MNRFSAVGLFLTEQLGEFGNCADTVCVWFRRFLCKDDTWGLF